jgi:hypothetical protein
MEFDRIVLSSAVGPVTSTPAPLELVIRFPSGSSTRSPVLLPMIAPLPATSTPTALPESVLPMNVLPETVPRPMLKPATDALMTTFLLTVTPDVEGCVSEFKAMPYWP